ncbi:MAG: hypothetical protein LLG04_08210 [Parachlamydia sp.]|nr:hypothetical protein [Parachlamydia sp.]
MSGSIGMGGLPPAIPELSERHPARVFDGLIARQASQALTLTLLCQSSSNKDLAADRLLVLFGKGIAQQLETQGLRDIYQHYLRQYWLMKRIFDEACKHYYEALVIPNSTFQLTEDSPVRQLRNDTGYTIRQTVLLTMQDFLDAEPDPFQLAHEHSLQRIAERTYGMTTVLQRILREYQDLHAFLSYACGVRVVHPLKLDRAVWISYEITLFKRDLLPGKRAIQLLTEWSRQNQKTQEIARRLFACFSLIPLVNPDIGSRTSPARIAFDRSDITLSDKEAFSVFLLKGMLETVYETLIGKKTDAACFVFVNSYAQLNLTFHTYRKLLLCIGEIGKAYPLAPPMRNPREYMQIAQVLQTTKQKIDDFGFRPDESSYQLIHAALLLAHLCRLLPHSNFQRWDTFEALYVLNDKGRLYEAWLMPLYPWSMVSLPEDERAIRISCEIEKLSMLTGEQDTLSMLAGKKDKLSTLTGEKQAFYLCHCAYDRLNLRPIPPDSSQETWRDEEKGGVDGLRRLVQDYNSHWPGKLNKVIYFLQDGYYAAPETQAIFERLFELLCHIPPGEEELIDRAFTGLQVVWRSYPFWQPLIPNAECYRRLIPLLQSTHKQLEEMYPLHENSSPSTPSYDFLLSLLLLCHLSRVIDLTPKAKEVWFDRLRVMTPAGRKSLLQKFLQPHFEWKQTRGRIDLERFFSRYPGLTNDQGILLTVQSTFDRRDLRSIPQPDQAEMEDRYLDFADTTRLIETLERLIRTPLPLRFVMTLLERPCVPQKIGAWLNKWEAIAGVLSNEDSSQRFLPRHLTQSHWECITDIAKVNGSDQIFQTISELLSGILLPIAGWKVYQPFLYLLIQGDHFRAQRQWAIANSSHLMVIHPLRSLSAKIEGNTLILRLVDNNLNTRPVRASLPQLPQNMMRLLLDLSDVLCNEYPSARIQDSQPRNMDQLLQSMIREYPQLQEKIEACTDSEAGRRQLNTVMSYLIDLKLGMRQALWQLFKRAPSVPTQQISLREKRRLAKQGNIYRCEKGFSLLPLGDEKATLNPKFSIPLAGKEQKIRAIYEKLSRTSKVNKISMNNWLSFDVAPDEGDTSDESGSSPESCSSDGPSLGLRPWTGIGVDVHLCCHETSCPRDIADPHAVEGPFVFYEITLHVSNDRTTSVTDKFPIQFHDKRYETMPFEDFQERICWLLAILQGEWYRKG